MAKQEAVLPVRAFMLHMSHYDPNWVKRKPREKPIDVDLALEVIDAMAQVDMNLLVIDIADGVRFKSHPELARPYSVPMATLSRIAGCARKRGIEVVPKLNFAGSGLNQHTHWMRPYHRPFDGEGFWRRAFLLIDEAIDACKPARYFHIGMDEDHWHSLRQYAETINVLDAGLKERGLRTIMWKDCQDYSSAEAHVEKSRASEGKIARDVIQVPWGYARVKAEEVRRLRRKRFEVWGAPGREPDNLRGWRDALLRYGGTGILVTQWIPCRPTNRKRLLTAIRELGPLCRGG
ncbi:MAG: hypothetical protein GXY85_06505 [Candidatus Brocadiaceae bacterium]|nr:hypothetical protein [Candidatus Brocadiaceae bacterium]